MRFDMHTHTTYSKHDFWGRDALNTPREMIKAAIKKGLSGMAITDHQTVKGSIVGKKAARTLKRDFKIITGLEIKTEIGDLLALGVKKNIPDHLSLKETIEKVHDLGGLAVAPHPFGEFGFRACLRDEAVKTDAIEIFNSTSCRGFQNNMAKELAKRYKRPVSAGSDAHCCRIVGNAGIICSGDPLEAIRKKKVKIFGSLTPIKDIAYLTVKKFERSFKHRI